MPCLGHVLSCVAQQQQQQQDDDAVVFVVPSFVLVHYKVVRKNNLQTLQNYKNFTIIMELIARAWTQAGNKKLTTATTT